MSDSDVEILDTPSVILQQTVFHLQQRVTQLQSSNTYYQQQIQSLVLQRQELRVKEEQSTKQLTQQKQSHELDISMKNDLIRNLEEELSSCVSELQQKSALIQDLYTQSNQDRDELNRISVLNEDYKIKIINQQNIITDLESQCTQYTHQLSQYREELDELSKKQVSSTEEFARVIEQYEEDSQQMLAKLIAEEQNCSKLRQNVADLSNEIKSKWDCKQSVQQFNEKLLSENIANINKIEQMNSVIAVSQERLEKTIQQRDHFKQSFFEASNRILSLQKQCQQLQQQLTQSKENLHEKQEYIIKNDNYQESYRKMQSLAKEQLEEIKVLKSFIKQQQVTVEDFKKKEDTILKEIAHIKFQANQQIQNLKMKHDQTIIQLHQQIDNLHVNLSYKDKQLESMISSNQQLKEDYLRIETNYTKLLNEQAGSEKMSFKTIKKQNQTVIQQKQQEQEKREQIESMLNE